MARRPAFDLSVYLVTDRDLCGGRALAEGVEQAARGGATLVQLREKTAGTREFVELARALNALLAPLRVPLIINDRLDVALAIGAAGAHLGQSDMPASLARELLGPGAILGLSLESMDQLPAAEALDVDYYGVSPIHPTPTKTDTGPGWGLSGLLALRAATTRPLVAIGGIGARNAAETIRAGADGVAVVSAICAAEDPAEAARELAAAVRAELASRRG